MARKGRKSSKKSVAKKPPTKAVYEATISELNQKLAELRVEFQRIDDFNFKLNNQLHNIEGEHGEVAGHLGRVLNDKNERIDAVEDQLIESEKLRIEEDNDNAERIKELEQNYKSTLTQLTAESQLLGVILSSLDEYRLERQETLDKFEQLVVVADKQDDIFKAESYDIKQKNVVEVETIKSEMVANLQQVTSDFTHSSQIRTAAYARRLIRENIDLQQELEKKLKTVLKLNDVFNKEAERSRIRDEEFESLNQLVVHLGHVKDHKEEIVKKIRDEYDHLKITFVENIKYKYLYESLCQSKLYRKFNINFVPKKMQQLEEEALAYKTELERMLTLHHEQEMEILALRKMIEQIRAAVELAIDSFRPYPKFDIPVTPSMDMIGVAQEKLHNLFNEFVMILSSHTDTLPKTPSELSFASISTEPLYIPGDVGLLAKDTPLLVTLPCQERTGNCHTIEEDLITFTSRTGVSNIEPIKKEVHSVMDIEMGSDLYVSSIIEPSVYYVDTDDVSSGKPKHRLGSSTDAGTPKTASGPVIVEVFSSQSSGAQSTAPVTKRMAKPKAKSIS